MRRFHDSETIIVEPFRVRTFPVVKDLVIDRSALDRIVQAGGFISARAGSAPEANSIPIPKPDVDLAMEAAVCIGFGGFPAAFPDCTALVFSPAKRCPLRPLSRGKALTK